MFYFFFGGIIVLLDLVSPKILNCFEYITAEIRFQYRFYCTDFWDKILLDDNYSEEYKTCEEKLKRAKETTRNASKQVKRHNKQIQKKYGRI